MELNHTIVWAGDPQASAAWLVETLGRPPATRLYGFHVVTLDNEVSLDYLQVEGTVSPQHYAVLVSEAEFDEVVERLDARGQVHWADPGCTEEGINRMDGGRGTYFQDPDAHLFEVLTRPYGSAP